MAFTAYELILDSDTITQVISSSLATNANVDKDRANGATGPSLLAMRSAAPVVNFTTGDLTTLIGLTNFFNSGLNVPSNGITVPLIKRADGGVFASGSNHVALTATSALTIPTEVSAQHDTEQGVTCTCETHLRSTDGRTIPYAVSDSASLASATFTASYKMGPVVINGTNLTRCKSWRVMTGLQVRAESYCGNEYPSELFIIAEEIDPMIEITFESPNALADTAALFLDLTSAAVWARRKADGGVTDLDTSSTHAKFSFSEGLAIMGGYEAAFGDNSSSTITLHGKSLTAALDALSA